MIGQQQRLTAAIERVDDMAPWLVFAVAMIGKCEILVATWSPVDNVQAGLLVTLSQCCMDVPPKQSGRFTK